nr:MAG TPA: hypothetical protein [Caudoviricetes sp.]
MDSFLFLVCLCDNIGYTDTCHPTALRLESLSRPNC